jgi:hypothetical protein
MSEETLRELRKLLSQMEHDISGKLDEADVLEHLIEVVKVLVDEQQDQRGTRGYDLHKPYLAGVKVGDSLWTLLGGWVSVTHVEDPTLDDLPVWTDDGRAYDMDGKIGSIRHAFWDEVDFSARRRLP